MKWVVHGKFNLALEHGPAAPWKYVAADTHWPEGLSSRWSSKVVAKTLAEGGCAWLSWSAISSSCRVGIV
jgi:hypothetical protein